MLFRLCDMSGFPNKNWSIGSITFSEARNREGKIQTARERVTPTNPQSAGQTEARNNLSDSVNIVQEVQGDGLLSVFDRSVSKLPGYQSLMSLYQRSKAVSGNDIVANSSPANIRRGQSIRVDIGSTTNWGDGTYDIDYSIAGGTPESGDFLTTIAVVREFPVASLGGLRVQNSNDNFPFSSVISFDFAGFPGANTGLLFFTFVRKQDSTDPAQVGRISWGLIT